MERGNIRQAAEKIWGASALAVKAYALWRDGRCLTSHGELWEYERKLEEGEGRWVHDAWMNAAGMCICFYKGWCSRGDVEKTLKAVQRSSWGFFVPPRLGLHVVLVVRLGSEAVGSAYLNRLNTNVDYGVHAIKRLWRSRVGTRLLHEAARSPRGSGTARWLRGRLPTGGPWPST